MAQQSRCLKDYLEYIKYERKLISLTKERVQLNKITTNNTIAVMIASRMKQLYSQALTRHSQNTRLWDEYLKFLQQFKFRSDISSTFEQMLQVYILHITVSGVSYSITLFYIFIFRPPSS